MTLLQAIVLGVVQGLTEFLPVSSSGHLIFFPKLFGWADQGLSFDVVMHLGTLLAVVLFFRTELWMLIKSFVFWKRPDASLVAYRRLGVIIVLSIIPAGVVGLAFGDLIENTLRSPLVIVVTFIFWGLMLGIAERYSQKKVSSHDAQHLSEEKLFLVNWKRALFIGAAQALALIPGTSRSGITMTAGMFSGLDKKTSARFSFLMSVPIIALAGLLQVTDMVQQGVPSGEWIFLGVGFLSALLSGVLAIKLLLKIIEKWSFMPFVVYRILVAIFILLVLV